MAHRILNNEADWHPVPGFEGRYEVTRDGRVRSVPRLVNSPAAGGQRRISGRELSIQCCRGYPAISGRGPEGQKRTIYVHRLIALTFVPNPEGKPHVNHIDGDKTNCAPENLEWVTHAENMRHAFATGLAPRPTSGPGEKSPAAKLSWEKVGRIRSMLREGVTHVTVARHFGVTKGAIGFIARNETWRVAQ